MKRFIHVFCILLSLLVISAGAMAQLTGTKTIPGDYATLAAAIADLNAQGVGSGGVTFNVAAGYTETFPSLTAGLITTTTASAGSPVVFQKSGAGANPVITAYTPGVSTTLDYIIAIAGGDYITFDAIDLQENAANTTATMQMEWGYALVKASAVTPFDGCDNVTIKNCTITLNRANTASVGIYLGNHISTATTALTITATTDAHNNNKFYHNTIQNVNTGIWMSGFAAAPTPFGLYDQNNDIGGASVGNGNTIQNFGGGTVAAYGVYGVYQNNLNVRYNTIADSVSVPGLASGGTLYGIYHGTGTNSSATLSNNTVTITKGANTSTVYGISCAAAGTGTTNINNNTFQNWTANGSSGAIYFIQNSGATATVNLNNNTISNNTALNTTGSVYFIYNSNGTPLISCTGNTINNISKTGAGGTVYGYYNFGGPTGGSSIVASNTFSNITLTGATSFYGTYEGTSTTQPRADSANTISNITGGTGTFYGVYTNYDGNTRVVNNTITNLSGGGAVYGISAGGSSSSGAVKVAGNSVNTLSSTGASALYGIYLGGTTGTTTNAYQNSVFNLNGSNASTLTYGIYVSAGTNMYVYNNFVSDLKATAATSTNAIGGLYIAGGTNVGAYYNSIYLNGTSSSVTTFGTSGIYASTTPTVDLRNNIVVNVSTPGPTGGFTVAYRRSTTTLTTYASVSNTNDFYVNPGAGVQRYFYSDGTAATNCDSTFAAYKLRVTPRDAGSFAENAPFINVATTPYNLHMNSSTPSQCESGGSTISTPIAITTDFDGTTRNASTPDVGADEYTGPGLDLSPPNIVYTALTNTSSTSNRTIVSTITDLTGVPTAGALRPRVYYKKSIGGTYHSQPGTLASGTATNGTWNFGIVNSDMGGVVAGDTVYYFVIAQDIVGTPNIGSNPGGAVATDVNTITTYPPAPNGYYIIGSISGVKTVGATGADYVTLTAAVADLNSKELVGALTLNLIDATYAGETFPIVIAANSGSNSTNRVTIKPATGVTATISGSSASALIKLNGADYVTIDGSNAGGTDRNLILTNTNTAASTEALWVSSLGTAAGATNVIIKNCVISTGIGTTASTYGIYVSGDDNDNLTIQNNDISKAYYGVYAVASATGVLDNLTIVGNSIGSNTPASQIGYTGVYVGFATGASITQNSIFKIIGTITTPVGIWLQTGVVSSSVTRNNIEDVTYTGTGGYGGRGIYVNTGSATSAVTIANNEVSVIGGDGYSSFSNSSPVGIYLDGTTGGLNIYYNSVYMSGNLTYNAATLTTAILVNTSVTALDLRNNVFVNDMVNTVNTGALNYAIYSYPTTSPFTTINYNDYYVSGTQGMLGRFNGINDTTLAQWRTATGQDVNSLNSPPLFNTTRNLQPFVGSPLLAAGTPIGGITVDILGVTRSVSNPSIGAYEQGLAAGPPSPALLVSPADSATGIARTASMNWADGGGGATGYKLYFGTNNPPTNIVNGTNLGLVTTYTPASPMTYATTYYWKIVPTNGQGDATGCPVWQFTIMADPTITSFPYSEGFEAATFPPAGWVLSGTKNWTRATSETHTGTGAAKISYLTLGTGIMTTPPIQLPTGANLEFWWKDDDITDNPLIIAHDTTWCEISADGGTTWTTLAMLSTASPMTAYTQVALSLASYAPGTVVLRWRDWSDGTGSAYGTGVDDIKIYVAPNKDIRTFAANITPSAPNVGTNLTVSAWIRNGGLESNPASVPLTYKIGSAPATSGDGVAQTFTPTWSGDSALVTFTTQYTPTGTGALTIYVRSFYTGDQDSTNDLASATVNVLPAGTMLMESFDNTTFPPTGWRVENLGSGNVWQRSTGGPHSGVGSAYYPYNSTYAANTWLISAGVTLTAGTPYRLSYWYKVASATYPENMKVAMGTVDSASGMTTILADHPSLIGTAYVQNVVRFTPSTTGTYYFGFHCYSLADMYNLFLDDVLVSLVPAVDMSLAGFFQSSGIPYPASSNSVVFAPTKQVTAYSNGIVTRLDENARGSKASVVDASASKGVENQFDNALYLPVSVKGAGSNVGANATTWAFNWNVEGVAQSPVSRPSLASGSTDTATASYTSSQPGTFYAIGKAVAAGDGDNSNDSLGARIRIYPDSYNRTIYDRGSDTVDTFIGWNSATTQMKAGVRFTATATRRLAGVDFITRSETIAPTGVWQVQVCSAGLTDSVPGPVMYTRLYSGLAYNAPDGDYITFAFDNTAPVFNSGENYWITVKAPAGILYPGAAHNTGFTTGRSFYESNTDTTAWIPLVITTERAWIMRSYDVIASTLTTLNVALATGWNLISNPVTNPIPGDSVRQLYPTSVNAYAFEFAGGYVQRYRLANGKGYWEKFPAAVSNSITGTPRTRDSIAVNAGWNIIGSISNTVDTSTIVSVPPGIRASAWFAYAGGYTQTTQIIPGKGYWVKANAIGKFVFANPLTAPAKTSGGVSAADVLHSVTITDANGNSQTLYFGADANNEVPVAMYDMPPAAPAGAFDARFESADGGTMAKTHAAKVDDATEFVIDVQSTAYPLTVTWNVSGGTAAYQLGDGNGGKAFAAREMVGEGSIKVTNSGVSRLTIKLIGNGQLPTEFALNQNYPNPFNPTTNIRYALPIDSKLTMEVYNVLGQRVRTLVNTDMVAGYHEVEWNGRGNEGQQLASGVYFLQMAAKGANGKSFSDIRKLMLLK